MKTQIELETECQCYDHEKHLEVKSESKETRYEVVVKDGELMTQVEEHIWLK